MVTMPWGKGERVVHTYRKPGSYVVNLIATDDSGTVNDAALKKRETLIRIAMIRLMARRLASG